MAEPADTPAVPDQIEPDDRPLPVLAEARALARPSPPPLPAVVAAGTVGFVAGVVAWTLVRILRRSSQSRSVRKLRRRRAKGLEITSSRSFLVDVHLLKR